MAQVAATLDELAAAGFPGGKRLAFVGGEPTRSPSLPAAVEAARQRGFEVVVQTNARDLAQGDLARQLRDLGVSSLDVSLHGPAAAVHDYHTNTPGSFRQTVAGVRQARAAGLPVALTCVVTRSNFRHLEELVQVAARLGAVALQLSVVEMEGRAVNHAAALVPAREMVRPNLLRALRLANRHRLAVVSGKHATNPTARRWFAGRVRPPVDSSIQPTATRQQPTRLPVLSAAAAAADARVAGLAS